MAHRPGWCEDQQVPRVRQQDEHGIDDDELLTVPGMDAGHEIHAGGLLL